MFFIQAQQQAVEGVMFFTSRTVRMLLTAIANALMCFSFCF
jgi:hypothetical protein